MTSGCPVSVMNLPPISVIIPCYNGAVYLGEAIESALNQIYLPLEVIVIDDGSTDCSAAIAESYGTPVRAIRQENRGPSAARNRGIELARGELIQFLDADDLLFPEKLQRQVPEVLRHPEALVYSDYELLTDGGKVIRGCAPAASLGTDPVVMLLSHCGDRIQTSAPIHWKEQLTAIGGFREELPPSEDRDLHLRLACAEIPFRFVPEILYTQRSVPGSLTSGRVRNLAQHRKLAWDAYEMLRRKGRLTDSRAAAFAQFIARAAGDYFRYGCSDEAWEYLREARKMHCSGGYEGMAGRLGPLLSWVRWLLPPWVYSVKDRATAWRIGTSQVSDASIERAPADESRSMECKQ